MTAACSLVVALPHDHLQSNVVIRLSAPRRGDHPQSITPISQKPSKQYQVTYFILLNHDVTDRHLTM